MARNQHHRSQSGHSRISVEASPLKSSFNGSGLGASRDRRLAAASGYRRATDLRARGLVKMRNVVWPRFRQGRNFRRTPTKLINIIFWDLLHHPVPLTIYLIGTLSWAVAVIAAAVALSQAGAPRTATIPLGLAGIIGAVDHAAPFGPVAMLLFIIAAFVLSRATDPPDATVVRAFIRSATSPTRSLSR
jgi:hypothetical protein